MKQIFFNRDGAIRAEVWSVYIAILLLNISAWSGALLLFQQHPLLLGTALLSFGLGLRHAVDADHIAAIDNVTRKLIQTEQRPIGVGFFFALGHSTVVLFACITIAWASAEIATRFEAFKEIGSLIGTLVSAFFLLIIATLNALILWSTYKTWRYYKRTRQYTEESLDLLGPNTSLLGRIIKPLFRIISRSWHMYPLGFLFGLGFDTATEIALLGIAATQSTAGLSPWAIIIFPLLFCAGMTLVDTLNGHLMIGAYGWAHAHPERKILYNLIITSISVVTAVVIGLVEVISLAGEKLQLQGMLIDIAEAISEHFAWLGYSIILLCSITWVISIFLNRIKVQREML